MPSARGARTAYRQVVPGSGAGVDLGRVLGGVHLEAGGAEVLVDRLLPLAGVLHLLDGGVDLLAEGLVALLDADAVALLGERLADDLELALVLRLAGVAGEDRVVRGQRVDRAGRERLDALGVGVVLLQLHARVLVLDLGRRRGALDRAQLLAGEGGGAGDRGVVGAGQQVLAGDEVRTGEGDLLLAGVGDRVGADDEVDLAGGQERLALRRGRLHEGDVALGVAELLGDVLGHVDVEAGVRRAVLQAHAVLLVLDADLEVTAAAATTTGGQADRSDCGHGDRAETTNVHGFSS